MSLFSTKTPRGYDILGEFTAEFRNYKISSIRMDDAMPIMHWRNEQISALRQETPLTEAEQQQYFRDVVEPSFEQKEPELVLVRYTLQDTLIGYGGLVHIDWETRSGEVSFLLKTNRTKDMYKYGMECGIFMQLLKKCAFEAMNMNRIHTESYAHRPWHVRAIEASGFRRETVLKQHALVDGEKVDAIIATCLREEYLKSIPD